jgi:hypothetical protein
MSKTVTGTVVKIDLNVPIKKKAGGTYPGWQMIYQTNEGVTETVAKHVNTLKYDPPLKATLEGLVPNDPFTMELEKGDTGFWEVKSLSKGNNLPTQAVGRVTTDEGSTPVRQTKTDKGTWETAEERQARQVLIVRQSCLAQAVGYKGSKATAAEVLATANEFVDWVFQKGLDTGPEAEVQ